MLAKRASSRHGLERSTKTRGAATRGASLIGYGALAVIFGAARWLTIPDDTGTH